ncbi:phage holin, LLH family, partial [Enterococcus sp.]
EADGPEKFNRAKSQLVDFLNKNKIQFTEDELNVLIESAVKSMKDGVTEGLKEGE